MYDDTITRDVNYMTVTVDSHLLKKILDSVTCAHCPFCGLDECKPDHWKCSDFLLLKLKHG